MRAALKEIPAEKTDFGPGKTPLYYNNKGLFSDPFIEERLPNLEKYSSHPSTKYLNKYWNCDEFDHEQFHKAFNDILNLWDKMDEDVARYCENEAQLEQNWIKPIFDILGWTYEVQVKIDKRGRKMWPDYSLFASQDAWKKSKNSQEIKKFFHATSVADAKAWDVSLDGKGYTNANPSFQIVTYMELTKKDWGILTNGREWRVYSLRSDSKHTTYFEIDLINILATKDTERFKYFYNFFRKEAFVKEASISDRCFLDFVFEDGQFYSQRVEENLQGHAYKVVDTICQGFLTNMSEPSDEELREVYEYSMYYLFKLMFVLNCESKGLLEVNKQDDYYEFSLRKRVFDLREQHESGKNWSSQPRTYNYINDLFELLKHGDVNIGVHGFGEEPFEIGSLDFYQSNKISDEYLNDAILDLACAYDEENNLQFIDYKILSPDHIGSLFEGLLEFSLVRNKRNIELLNTKGERKSTGAYYTPAYLVNHIVSKTLEPMVTQKKVEEILNLTIMDPAMGSGHFLLGIIKFLEKEIQEIKNSGVECELTFEDIKKTVAHNCVFGVDINPLAVELAKFSIWIYTASKGDTLEPLADQLVCNNTLDDNLDLKELFVGQLIPGSVDAIIGNPPYIGEKGNTDIFDPIKKSTWGKKYYQAKMDYFYFFFHKSLDLLREEGALSFVTTNYFSTATGGKTLREDLKKRANIYSIINFSEAKIFKSAAGQHNQVTFLRKSKKQGDCELISFTHKGMINSSKVDENTFYREYGTDIVNLKSKEVYQGKDNYLNINRSAGAEGGSIIEKIIENGVSISEYADVYQGIVSGADKVTDKIIKENPKENWEKDDGIFVLSKDELRNLNLNKEELEVVKPFFKNSDIQKWSTSTKANKHIIFIDKKETEDSVKKKFPNLYRHLSQFKSMLVAKRRKLKEREDKWFTLNRGTAHPEIFTGYKIVAPQRSKANTFGYSKGRWYASADVYFIIPKDQNSDDQGRALLGVLNSNLYYFWLYTQGKRKGDYLELYRKPLGEVIVPEQNDSFVKSMSSLVQQYLDGKENVLSKINDLIYSAFGFDQKEIAVIEELFAQNCAQEELEEKLVA